MAFANLKKLLNSLFFQPALDGVEIVTCQMLFNKMLEYDTGMVTSQWGYFRSLNTKFDVNTCTSYFFIFFLYFFYFIFFYKKFMPINAKGTTVAQANSECTLITTDYNKEVLKCDLNVESVGWFVILLDNEFHEDTVLGT